MASPWHLGIDFGTSNSAAAHTSPANGGIEAIALSHRSTLMPSAVYVRSGATGIRDVYTGDIALREGRRDPSRLMLSPKRFIDHEAVQLEGDDVPTRLIVSAVIKAMVDRAKTQHVGEDPETVTLTHPERWSSHAVGNLIEAARAADIPEDKLRLISEPRAAAIHYAATSQMGPNQHVAVFDFGGGTLDIAVLRAEHNGDFRVVAAKGDNSLGGRTIDNLVFRWVVEQIDHEDPDFADELRKAPPSVMNTLQENIREAKEMLSDTSSSTITISTPTGERDMLITREEFNRIIDQPVQRAAELTEAVLREAGVSVNDAPIFLTGGSSRIPYVQDRLGSVGRVMSLDDPKTVVARGAVAATIPGFSHSFRSTGAPQPQQHATQSAPMSYRQQGNAGSPWSTSQNQANAFAQTSGTPQSAGAGRTAVGTGEKKKSKAPMIVSIVAALALVAGSVWAAMSLGGDEGEEAEDQPLTVNTQTEKTSLTIERLIPGIDQVLPARFVESADSCRTEGKTFEESSPGFVDWAAPSTVGYNCSVDSVPAEIEDYSSTVYLSVGDGAAKMSEDIHRTYDHEPRKLNEDPQIYLLEARENTGRSSVFIYYPGSKLALYTYLGSDYESADDVKTWAKAFGFM